MWGDYIYNAKTKKVSTWTPSSSSQPIFVKMVLSTLWKLYKSVYKRNDEVLHSILETINITLTPRELKITDEGVLVKLIMGRWLPLYKAILSRMKITWFKSIVIMNRDGGKDSAFSDGCPECAI